MAAHTGTRKAVEYPKFCASCPAMEDPSAVPATMPLARAVMTVPSFPAGATRPPIAKTVTMSGPTGRPRTSSTRTMGSAVEGSNSSDAKPAMRAAQAIQRAFTVKRRGQYATERAAAAELSPMTA